MRILYYWFIVTAYVMISLLSIFYTPIILVLRKKARYAVYNYVYSKNIYIHNNHNTVSNRVNKLSYILYNYFVWIWLYDSNDSDLIDKQRLYNVIKSSKTNFIKHIIIKDTVVYGGVDNISPLNNSTLCKDYCYANISLFSVLLNILLSDDINFKFRYMYTRNNKLVFNKRIFGVDIGWVEIPITTGEKMSTYKLIFKIGNHDYV